jgi:signal peptidase I
MRVIDKKLIFVGLSLAIVAAVGIWIILFLGARQDVLSGLAREHCSIQAEERIVRGNSLSGLIENGETVTVFFGYYQCNKIKRGDLVLYSYAGNETPLIKIVKGVPGDSFKLEQIEQKAWHILINDKVVRNSAGIPYLIFGSRYEMLALYEKDFKGKIPEGAYLLLGNITSGAVDSTRFGFVSQGGILGKAVR